MWVFLCSNLVLKDRGSISHKVMVTPPRSGGTILKGVTMNFSPQLQGQVSRLAHRFGSGWDGDDMAQDCFVLLWQLPESKAPQALTICRNLCIDKLRAEEIRASSSLSALSFQHVLYGECVDVEKYKEHIKDLRLRAIVDQYIDREALSQSDCKYLQRHRNELDRDLRKYLRQKSAWMIWFDKCEPFLRPLCKLIQESVRIQMVRTQ